MFMFLEIEVCLRVATPRLKTVYVEYKRCRTLVIISGLGVSLYNHEVIVRFQ